MWQWLHNLSSGQATFLGSLTGSSIGLIALLLGALFNAHLNRRRDDRRRREDRRAVATALQAELVGLSHSLQSTIGQKDPERRAEYAVIVRVFPRMVPKLGLLEPDTIRSVIDAYNEVDAFCQEWDAYVRRDDRGRPDTGLNEKAVDIIRKAIADLARATG